MRRVKDDNAVRPATPFGPRYVPLDEVRRAQRIGGVWYELRMLPIPVGISFGYDVALDEALNDETRADVAAFHGADVYAVAKRPMAEENVRRLREQHADGPYGGAFAEQSASGLIR